MPSPHPLPDLKASAEDSNQSYRPTDALSRQMRLELTFLAVIVLGTFMAAIILPSGDWLDGALDYQGYHVDDLIAAVFALSLILSIFMVRWWRRLRQEVTARTLVVKQMEHGAFIDAQFSQMTSLLHACFTVEETSDIITHFARQLFPDHGGALFVFRSSRNQLELVAEWSQEEDTEPMFAPYHCWALRQGQIYAVSDPQNSIRCLHVKESRPYMCLPMMAHGEVLALLHVYPKRGATSGGDLFEAHRALLADFADHIALALANLKLRDTLRQQSIRDPLTGLFNRRYLEEALAIEIERAKRNNGPLSVMMLDLDHFKRFNDTHGHDAGDAILQALGRFLQRQVRAGDIACRYGGEEFTLILPGASLEVTRQRAEQLCEGVRTLGVDIKGQVIGPLTVSIGIASLPDHGAGGEAILLAADMALYHAKSAGRDRAVVAV